MKFNYKKAAVLTLAGLMALTPLATYAGQADADNQAISAESHLSGGWEIADNSAVLPAEVQEAFEKATAQLLGMDYTPVSLIASQLVSGMNYKILCKGTAVVPDAEADFYVLTIYADLAGNAEITDITQVDLLNLSAQSFEEEGEDFDYEFSPEEQAIWDKISSINDQLDIVSAENIDTWIKLYGNASSDIVDENYDEKAYIEASELTAEEKQVLLDQLSNEEALYHEMDGYWAEFYALNNPDSEYVSNDNSGWNKVAALWNRSYAVSEANQNIWDAINFLVYKNYDSIDRESVDYAKVITETLLLTDEEKEAALRENNTMAIFDKQANMLIDAMTQDITE